MRPAIDQPIPIRRTTTKKTTLQPRLCMAAITPVPSPHHLTLRLRTQQRHQRQMNRAVQLNRPAGLGQPHLHADGIQPRDHLAELVTVESPLVLPYHHSIKLTIPNLRSGQQRRRRWPVPP